MPTVGFEPTISAGDRPQTYALDRAATGTGRLRINMVKNLIGESRYIYAFYYLKTQHMYINELMKYQLH